MTLRAVLQPYEKPGDLLGGEGQADLIKDLRAYRTRQTVMSLVIIAGILVVFALGVRACLLWMENPKQLSLVMGAMGLSVGGALALLRSTAKEWGRVDLIMILVQHGDEKRAKKLLDDLLTSLKPDAPQKAMRARSGR